MDTLHERLAELADDAPTGGAPPAELWARGKHDHRLRVAALAATVLVVGVVGTGIGVRLVDGGDDRSDVPLAGVAPSAGTISRCRSSTPLGRSCRIWGHARPAGGDLGGSSCVGGGAPEAVGLVAESGMFGTLPIDVSEPDEATDAGVALSPDGRRIAYQDPAGQLIVGDLVTGENYASEARVRAPRGVHLGRNHPRRPRCGRR